jgi:hypothetical protein
MPPSTFLFLSKRLTFVVVPNAFEPAIQQIS